MSQRVRSSFSIVFTKLDNTHNTCQGSAVSAQQTLVCMPSVNSTLYRYYILFTIHSIQSCQHCTAEVRIMFVSRTSDNFSFYHILTSVISLSYAQKKSYFRKVIVRTIGPWTCSHNLSLFVSKQHGQWYFFSALDIHFSNLTLAWLKSTHTCKYG